LYNHRVHRVPKPITLESNRLKQKKDAEACGNIRLQVIKEVGLNTSTGEDYPTPLLQAPLGGQLPNTMTIPSMPISIIAS